MKVLLRFLTMSCVVVSIFLGMPERLQAEVLQIHTPANKSYLEQEQVNLVVSVTDPNAMTLQVQVGGKSYARQLMKATQKRQVCLPVLLSPGLNRIEVMVSGGGGVIERKDLTVYLRSALLKSYQVPPEGFKRYYFHEPDREAACSSCHRMEANLHDLNPKNIADSPCYTCHKHKSSSLYTHKPVAAGACLSCHEVTQAKRKYTTRKPDKDSCFICHNVQGKLWKGQRVHHGPTAVGNCTVCHDPHGSYYPAFVKMHPTDLCLNCHHDKKTGLHVIAGFFAKGHPVRGAKNPLKKDRLFSCASCHNPHAGNNQNLLNQERENMDVYCRSCHKL